jgi:hypothetical protein
MHRIAASALLALLLTACDTIPAHSEATLQDATDGLTAETAVRLHDAKTEAAGIAAEKDWIQKNYPGARVKSQSLLMGSRPMDLIKLELPSGENRDIYFDISSFFGKM